MALTIYILKLEGGKYYIGKTTNLEQRLEAHQTGTASAWTRRYAPLLVVKTIPNASHFDEDRYTKEYMTLYGIENVRGGSYTEMELSETQKEALSREIRGATDCCFRCGRSNHFASNCFAGTDVRGNTLSEDEEGEDEEEDEEEEDTCFRCGNIGHYAADCYARRHVRGYWLS